MWRPYVILASIFMERGLKSKLGGFKRMGAEELETMTIENL